jgi:hypothetical protein
MIFILDNGLEYSDHQITFIESPDDLNTTDLGILRELLDLRSDEDEVGPRGPHLLGMVQKLDWWHGDLLPLAEHLCCDDVLTHRVRRYFWKQPSMCMYPGLPSPADAIFIEPLVHEDGSTNPDHDTFWYLRREAIAKLTPSLAQRIVADWRKDDYVPERVIEALLEVVK